LGEDMRASKSRLRALVLAVFATATFGLVPEGHAVSHVQSWVSTAPPPATAETAKTAERNRRAWLALRQLVPAAGKRLIHLCSSHQRGTR
jgi:hypothetical protein